MYEKKHLRVLFFCPRFLRLPSGIEVGGMNRSPEPSQGAWWLGTSIGALLVLAVPGTSLASCWASGEGASALYRQPSVVDEYATADRVVIGQAIRQHRLVRPDDPDGIEWTIYTVKVIIAFKGSPRKTLRLGSENSSARFDLEMGGRYLLFIRQPPAAGRAAGREWPRAYVDNCGNSGLTRERGAAIHQVKALSEGG